MVKDLPENLKIETLSGVNHNIYPAGYDNTTVMFVEDKTRTNTGRETNRQMNIRFIKIQLGIAVPDSDKREMFYLVRNKCGGVIDLKGSSQQQYISFSIMLKNFGEALVKVKTFEYPYWGFALEYLGVYSKDTVITYDGDGTARALSVDDMTRYVNAPFFLIICEKESTLVDFIGELRNRGYTHGFFGLVLKGYAITTVIKLMLRVNNKEKFKVFTLGDFDLNGIQIYLDLLNQSLQV
jgi:hypothetical protein